MARRLSGGLRTLLGLPGVEAKSLDSRAISSYRGYAIPGQPYHNEWNTDRAVREGFQANPYVFRAVEVCAQNAIDRRIRLRRDDPDDGPIIRPEELDDEQRQLLKVLNRVGNPWEVAPIFRHRLIAQYLLSSRGVFVEAIRTRRDTVWGLLLLDPDLVEPMPTYERDETGQRYVANPLGAFRVTRQAMTHMGGEWQEELPAWDPEQDHTSQPSGVIFIRSPHPTILARGMSPMEAAGLSADLDRHARLYNRRFLQQDGRPGGILGVKGQVSEATEQRLQSRFEGGPEAAGRTTVIEADDLFWQDTSGTPRDTQWGDTMDRMRREISIAFGVPESVLGDASGRTFDNADAEFEGFWQHKEGPLLRALDAQLDVLTPGGYRDEVFLGHDLSDVYVLGRHKRAEQDRALAQYQAGAITLDDLREKLELEPLNIPATRTLHIPPGKIIADDGTPEHDGDADAVAALPMMGTPPPVDPSESARAGAALGAAEGARIAENNVAAWRVRNTSDRGDGALIPRAEAKQLGGDALPAVAAQIPVQAWQVEQAAGEEGEQSRAHPPR